MDDVRKFLPKAPTFFEHSASFPLPRSSPQCVTPSYSKSSPCSSYLSLPLFSTMSGTRLDVNYWLVFSAMRSRTYGDTTKVL